MVRYPQSQKEGLRGQAVGKYRLMILSSQKWHRSTCFTQRAMCGGAPSCKNTGVESHRLARRTDCSNNERYRWPVTLPPQTLQRCAFREKKNEPTMKVAVKATQTITCEEWNGICRN
ncbi:hypothetical protein TNCV_4094131 [Trichonephila clavipes]|nr:hypothetical protein TNCV_4094131 [Trichonephila clavipes]